MLSILRNGGQGWAPLAPDEERLLDDWASGQLAPDGPAAALVAALVRRNVLAAERLLERRLLDLAGRGPAAPPLAAATIAAATMTAPAGRVALPPPALPGRPPWSVWPWRWPSLAGGLAGGLVLASVLAIGGVPLLREAMRGEPPLQVALVSIGDRGALFEPTDIRMRGGERAPVPVGERRFRDLEIPADAVKRLVADGARDGTAADAAAVLPLGPRRDPTRVLVDAALRARADTSPEGTRLPVRLYDLDDPRAVELRAALGVSPRPGERLFLLTMRP